MEHLTSLLAKYPGEEAGYRCAVEQLNCTGLCDSWGRGSPFYATCAQPRLTAAKRFGIKAVGFDLDPRRVQESRANVLKAGVSHLVR